MRTSFWEKEIAWGVKRSWLALALSLYSLLYLTYAVCLTTSEMSYVKITYTQTLQRYLFSQAFDYSIKFLLSVPLVFFYFKILKNKSLWVKTMLHFITCIAFVYVWQQTFYNTMELMGRGHLRGSAQVWDLYITTLIYIVQFGFLHAFEYYHRWQKQKELEHQLRQATLQSELSAIRAQLNPHFLYNVFNTISAALPPEQEKTREMIAELADLFRYQLKASRTELVSLREEMDFTQKYLALEKARFGERLNIKIAIDAAILDEKIPSMIIQPIVENCLKHGLATKIEGGEVSIAIKKEANALKFDIRDTGVGIKDKKKPFDTEGVGLKNTQLRLEKLYHSTLVLTDNAPSGLVVQFDLPLPLPSI